MTQIVSDLIGSFDVSDESDRRLRTALTECTHTGLAPEWSVGIPALVDYVDHLMAQRAGQLASLFMQPRLESLFKSLLSHETEGELRLISIVSILTLTLALNLKEN